MNFVEPSKMESEEKLEIIDEEINFSMIEMLDNDCLSKIFSYLPLKERLEMEQVCPRFHDATEQHWFDVKTLEFIVSPSEKSFIENILSRCGRYVKNLTLLPPPKTTDTLTLDILNMLDALQPESPINFVEKISEMKNLRRIKVSNIWDRSTDDSTRAINNLPDEMEEISFDITSKGLINFAFDNHSRLNLERFTDLCSLTLHGYSLDQQTMETICNKEKLKKLNLSSCFIEEETSVSQLIKLSHLTHLDIHGIIGVNDTLLINLVSNCPNLKHLNISSCMKVTNRAIIELSKLKYLEELFMSYLKITDGPIAYFNTLKKLNCSFCEEVCDSGIIKLFKNCQYLDYLNISKTAITYTTVIFAYDETKYRKNDVILQLFVDQWVMAVFGNWENKSPFLIIHKQRDGVRSSRRPTNSFLNNFDF